MHRATARGTNAQCCLYSGPISKAGRPASQRSEKRSVRLVSHATARPGRAALAIIAGTAGGGAAAPPYQSRRSRESASRFIRVPAAGTERTAGRFAGGRVKPEPAGRGVQRRGLGLMLPLGARPGGFARHAAKADRAGEYCRLGLARTKSRGLPACCAKVNGELRTVRRREPRSGEVFADGHLLRTATVPWEQGCSRNPQAGKPALRWVRPKVFAGLASLRPSERSESIPAQPAERECGSEWSGRKAGESGLGRGPP